MKSALRDQHRLVLDHIHQPMFAIDPSGPESGPVGAQGFGLADAAEGVALDGADQMVDS